MKVTFSNRRRRLPDGQSTVGPVPPPLQEGLILLVEVQRPEQRAVVLIPGGLVLGLVDEEGLQQHAVRLLAHAQLLRELGGPGPEQIYIYNSTLHLQNYLYYLVQVECVLYIGGDTHRRMTDWQRHN